MVREMNETLFYSKLLTLLNEREKIEKRKDELSDEISRMKIEARENHYYLSPDIFISM